jgi:histidine triad (HIT) family protein
MSEDCIFCKIVDRQIGDPPLYQDDEVTAFRDIHPLAPTHILIVPNKHLAAVSAANVSDQSILGKMLLVAGKLARDEHLEGYRLVINNGSQAGQEVLHLHLHLMGGRKMRSMG